MFWHIITKYIEQFNTVYLPKSPEESNNREFPKPIDPKQLSRYKLAPVGSTSFLLCISSRKRASERAQLPKASDEVDVTFRPLNGRKIKERARSLAEEPCCSSSLVVRLGSRVGFPFNWCLPEVKEGMKA